MKLQAILYYAMCISLVIYSAYITFSLFSVESAPKKHKERKMVVGIFSDEKETEKRDWLRKTTLSLRESCNKKRLKDKFPSKNDISDFSAKEKSYHNAKKNLYEENCRIDFIFVLENVQDKSKIREEERKYGDVVILPHSTEKKRVFRYFDFIVENFGEADYVAVMSISTLLFTDRIVELMDRAPRRGLYCGELQDRNQCGNHEYCPYGWCYMLDGMYFLSFDLVKYISKRGYKHAQNGPQEVEVGRCLWSACNDMIVHDLFVDSHKKESKDFTKRNYYWSYSAESPEKFAEKYKEYFHTFS